MFILSYSVYYYASWHSDPQSVRAQSHIQTSHVENKLCLNVEVFDLHLCSQMNPPVCVFPECVFGDWHTEEVLCCGCRVMWPLFPFSLVGVAFADVDQLWVLSEFCAAEVTKAALHFDLWPLCGVVFEAVLELKPLLNLWISWFIANCSRACNENFLFFLFKQLLIKVKLILSSLCEEFKPCSNSHY